uniref:N/A n=1 Tax=Ganoderma boninense TaxID=34458 RepID=A0A5K1K7G9_9APHY|nr:N/A [Ganoderma boninense]
MDEIMLPDHLLLRVAEPESKDGHRRRLLVNWPAYKFGIETMLQAYGLEGHLTGGPSESSATREQWKAEEEVCTAIIGCNVKDFAEIFGDLRPAKLVCQIWQWLSRLDKEEAPDGMDPKWK